MSYRADEYDNIVRATIDREKEKDLTMDEYAGSVFNELCKFLKDEYITVDYEVDQLFIEVDEKYKWTADVDGVLCERID